MPNMLTLADSPSVAADNSTSTSAPVRGITRFTDMTSRLLQALDAVARLANLPVNWDTYGSEPIQREAIRTARRLLMIVDIEVPPVPHIAPVPGGGIGIELIQAGRQLEFSIYPDGLVEYSRFIDDDEVDEEDDSPLNLENTARIQNLIRWLRGKRES